MAAGHPHVLLTAASPWTVTLAFVNPTDAHVVFEVNYDAGIDPHPNPCVIGADPLPGECAGKAYMPEGELRYHTVWVSPGDVQRSQWGAPEALKVRLAIGGEFWFDDGFVAYGWEFDWVAFEPRPVSVLALGGTAAVGDAALTEVRMLTGLVPIRLAGSDRYGTAAAIVADAFRETVDTVYVATGANFPDALAGSAAAATMHAPVLLVGPDHVPAAIATELQRLAPERIRVLGGPSAVSDAVLAQLQHLTGVTPTRLAGPNRYDTAAAIVADAFDESRIVYVATGANFPDALAGSAAAATMHAPVLLVDGDTVAPPVATELYRLLVETEP